MKLIRDILGRLLYVIIGAIIAPIAFTILFPPNHQINPASQAMKIAEILATGLNSDSQILASPEALSKFISKKDILNQNYFTTPNFLFAVLSESNQIPSFYIMLPRGDYYVRVNQDGQAMLEKIKTANK